MSLCLFVAAVALTGLAKDPFAANPDVGSAAMIYSESRNIGSITIGDVDQSNGGNHVIDIVIVPGGLGGSGTQAVADPEAYRPAITPPSTGRTAPVIQAAASEARKRMASTTSCGWPIRPKG